MKSLPINIAIQFYATEIYTVALMWDQKFNKEHGVRLLLPSRHASLLHHYASLYQKADSMIFANSSCAFSPRISLNKDTINQSICVLKSLLYTFRKVV
jgi:hypothetical protein